jgi:uncharacterized protein YndB with AHSA1/START domain
METANAAAITVQTTVAAPIEKVWDFWTKPEHIMNWCAASDDWHAPYADNDPRTGGNFKTTMAAKDGSFSFDFGGTYDSVVDHKSMSYTMGDGRTVSVGFEPGQDGVNITETFDPESQNPVEMQRGGWQAILDNFKKYTESN